MNGGGEERKGGGEKRGMLMFLRRFKEREAGSFVLRIIASANHSDTHLNLRKKGQKEKKENKKKLSLQTHNKADGQDNQEDYPCTIFLDEFLHTRRLGSSSFFLWHLIFCDANL